MPNTRGHIELPAIGILKPLGDGERHKLSQAGYSLHLAPGEDAVSQGTRQDSLYILIRGGLVVWHERHGEEIEVGRVREGESFGEMAIIDPAKAIANVRATSECLVWRVRRSDLDEFILLNPDAGLRLIWEISGLIVRRLRKRTEDLAAYAEEFEGLGEKLRPLW